MINFKTFWDGIKIKAKSVLNSDTLGEIETSSSTNKTYLHNGTTRSPLVTADHAETLVNKIIDADNNTISDLEVDNLKTGVLNTSITLASASDLQVPSALAVKTFVEDSLALQNEASEITYDNTTSGLTATNVQDAIDEVDFDLDATQVILSDHIADTSDAHDASSISNVPAGTIAATDVQAAINELDGDIQGHITDTTDAHDASAISNVPSGNLTSTDVQSALNELQTEIDGFSGFGDVNGPASSTDNAIARFDSTTGKLLQNSTVTLSDTGVVASLSLDADTNTITNIEDADIKSGANIAQSKIANLTSDLASKVNTTGGSIITPARLDMKQDTLANLFTYALTATDGQLVFATDTEETYVVKNNTLSAVGGGTGGLDTILQLTASEQLSDWSTGDNATFLGGGTLAGTFAKNTSTPLHGTASYQYTQAAGSLNDYLASATFPVDIRFRGSFNYLSFPYKYDGATSDIQIIVYDVTNSTVLTTISDTIQGTNNANQTAVVSVFIPLTCTNVKIGFHVKVLNSGKIFQFDDIQLSSTVYGNVQINNETEWQSYVPTLSGAVLSSSSLRWRRSGSELLVEGTIVTSSASGSEFRISLPNNYVSSASLPTLSSAGIMLNNLSGTPHTETSLLIEPSVSYFTYGFSQNTQVRLIKRLGNDVFSANTIAIQGRIPIQGWAAGSNAIATPTQQISSDSLPFTFKATAIVDADPVGTFNTYFKSVSTQSSLNLSGTAPTQTVSDMNANGIRLYPTAFNAASTAALPSKVVVSIGKGLKNYALSVFGATGKTLPGLIDSVVQSSTVESGVANYYNPTTGLLTIEVGMNTLGTITSRRIIDTDTGALSAGYMVFNASTTPSITALPVLAPRIATLSDVKTSGTDAGTFTSGSFQTRTLNTLVDPTGIVTSLTSNQFILPAGEYYIEGSAPGYRVTNHQIKLRNITAGSDSIVGTSEFVDQTASGSSRSFLSDRIVVITPTTFELQHRCDTTVNTNGLGRSNNYSVGEIYAKIKITKVK